MTINIVIPKTRLAYTERYLSDKSQIPLHNKTNPTPVSKREIVCLILLLLNPLIQIVQEHVEKIFVCDKCGKIFEVVNKIDIVKMTSNRQKYLHVVKRTNS